ncbi:uncharacterized protein A4U43_C04F24710 [Asparagus officinalis]|uniref:Uncharacterized protein n=1 Tax=Asparagus officinalis TaxID=4686 RepID=A0A5P1F405_ASPOF|nr:uncharacterized protein A4U43_C04F24710 [Asparagus officinalis]
MMRVILGSSGSHEVVVVEVANERLVVELLVVELQRPGLCVAYYRAHGAHMNLDRDMWLDRRIGSPMRAVRGGALGFHNRSKSCCHWGVIASSREELLKWAWLKCRQQLFVGGGSVIGVGLAEGDQILLRMVRFGQG